MRQEDEEESELGKKKVFEGLELKIHTLQSHREQVFWFCFGQTSSWGLRSRKTSVSLKARPTEEEEEATVGRGVYRRTIRLSAFRRGKAAAHKTHTHPRR